MANINLLPWREALREEKKKEFVTQLVGVCLLAAIAAFVWIKYVDAAIESQKSRNDMLQTEINLLAKQVAEIKDLKKRRRELLDRMRVIQDLEGKRSIIVHYFDEFARAVPDGVYMESVDRNGDLLNVVGIAESNGRVSAFLRKLDESEWFTDPNLKSVVASPKAGPQAVQFRMSLKTILPAADEDGKDS